MIARVLIIEDEPGLVMALTQRLGGTPRIEVGTAPPRGYHGDVQVAFDPDDVGTLLTPQPSKPGP